MTVELGSVFASTSSTDWYSVLNLQFKWRQRLGD